MFIPAGTQGNGSQPSPGQTSEQTPAPCTPQPTAAVVTGVPPGTRSPQIQPGT